MKRSKILLLLLMGLVLILSSCRKVPAGNVGIKYYLLGSEKGVDKEELSPGRYYIGINEELFLFPTFKQNKTWTSDEREDSEINEEFVFQSSKGLRLTASVGMEYHIPKENVSEIFQQYKKGLEEITNKVLRNAVRDAFNMASSKRTAEEVYGEGKMIFMAEVTEIAEAEALERGIVIDDIFLIGNIGIPKTVTEALNLKIQATQKAQQRENELRQATAEAAKVVAESKGIAEALLIRADAEAKSNKIVAASLTSTLVEYRKIEKWNGALPTVTGGSIPMLDLKSK